MYDSMSLQNIGVHITKNILWITIIFFGKTIQCLPFCVLTIICTCMFVTVKEKFKKFKYWLFREIRDVEF